ncbi:MULTISPECIES: hypothetical protein [Nocardia]|uniref:hypothetical protein n=1 Tax=Nocardia TaxID=1817 RepID=UPI000FD76552|nr:MULTISPECIES: hypothetical protein [Nocardia]MBF6189270.1 hypothetical protein [Nocardia farcinica]MBF6246367.1 hypothetical protein [Nocardia elegans]MBF6314909.1 hypothetical protein [Nocardia farcinica]MBF6411158.1 hypothetical protein [Nocardia farcinica]UEX26306.1 hypothetical protein LMJ57_30630 [Nocardia farcinica]
MLVIVTAGCGSSDTTSTSSATSAPVAAPSAGLESGPTSPLGGTLKIWGGANLSDKTQLAEYTVSNPRTLDGRWTVDVVIACRQGNGYVPGTFEVLTTAGRRLEQFNPYSASGGQLSLAGALIAGERREGYISFEVPADDQVAKVVLYHGTLNPPAAFWTVGS